MKRALFQFLNLFMVGVVLMSSTGFGLVDQSCRMRGKRTHLVGADQQTNQPCAGCSAGQHKLVSKPIVKKSTCCDEQTRYENVDFSASLTQHIAKLIKTITDTLLGGVMMALAWVVNWIFDREASLSIAFASSSPPLPSGRALLALIQSLLI
jgi:hypothetical protein